MSIYQQLKQEIDRIPAVDIHTHLGVNGLRQCRHAADLLSYHWLHAELVRAAGKPFASDPAADPEAYMREVTPWFQHIRNTVNARAMLGMLKQLYDWQEPSITPDNWQELDQRIRSHAQDEDWIAQAMDKALIPKLILHHGDGKPEPQERFYTYEYAEYFYTVSAYEELERCGDGTCPATLAELKTAVSNQIKRLVSEQQIIALHVWPEWDWLYLETPDAEAQRVLTKLGSREEVSLQERRQLSSWTADVAADIAGHYKLTVQVFHGMLDSLGEGHQAACGYAHPQFFRQLLHHTAKHKNTLFDLFLATPLPGHETASLSRTFANVSVSGAWWHGFSPTVMDQLFRHRLELLPMNSWCAFFSDGYTIEWVCAKLLMTRMRLTFALSNMVDEDLLDRQTALQAARAVLHDNAFQLYPL